MRKMGKSLTLVKKRNVTIILILCQLIFITLFAIFGWYSHDDAVKVDSENVTDITQMECEKHYNEDHNLQRRYPMFQDVHVMIFVGFGFLMTFLKKYGFSSIGMNFLLSALVIQWALIIRGMFSLIKSETLQFTIAIDEIINADFAAGSVLISLGAVLGKLSPEQYIVMAVMEVVIYAANEFILTDLLLITDAGGSIIIHTFGAYFGLAVAAMIYNDQQIEHSNESTTYHSDLFSMIGTIFLWMFWPSFNSAVSSPDEQYRAVVNTYLSLASCCVMTFAISSLVKKEGKIEMVYIQNASLAGGVAMGTSANLMISPYGSAIVGSLAAMLSVVGYKFITPFLSNKLHIHDTCGVNNLHGMPGILAALIGAGISGTADFSTYGFSLFCIFPARSYSRGSRTAGLQAAYQIAGVATTLGLSIVGGIIVGLILKLPIFTQVRDDLLFNDEAFWELPLEIVGSNEITTDLDPHCTRRCDKDFVQKF